MAKTTTQTLPLLGNQKQGLWYNVRKYRAFYIMATPALLYFFLFDYVPIVGLLLAFKDFKVALGVAGIFTGDWVGFAHFSKFFNSYYFSRVFVNTLIISGLKLLFGFPAPIILALLLNELRGMFFKRFVQTVSYLPYFLSWAIVASLITILLSPSAGIVTWVFEWFGMDPVYVLGSSTYFRSMLVISDVWKSIGYGSIIYLAAIAGIDPEMYEAAKMDGATRIQRMIHITLPGLKEVIIILFILNFAGILNAGFEQIFLLYSPAVYNVADVIDTYVFREGIVRTNYSFGTAVGLTKSVIALVLVIVTNQIARRFGSGGLW